MSLAIALVSGGMDSLVSAATALKENNQVAFLHLSYGQRTAERERKSFEQITDFYQIPREFRKVIDVSFLTQISGSSLVDEKMELEVFDPANPHGSEIPSTYVPFRNTHIISMGVSWAEVIGADYIYIGAVAEDSSGYPDCRPSYYAAMNSLIKEGTKEGNISIKTPIINLSKAEIVKRALELEAPLELSWSCYASSDLACGKCNSCGLRLRGFSIAGATDPIKYA